MQPGDTFKIGPEAITQDVGGELIILDLATERYLSVDPVGARIWDLLQADRLMSDVLEELVQRYGVARERVESDLEAFVASLESLGLGRLQPA